MHGISVPYIRTYECGYCGTMTWARALQRSDRKEPAFRTKMASKKAGSALRIGKALCPHIEDLYISGLYSQESAAVKRNGTISISMGQRSYGEAAHGGLFGLDSGIFPELRIYSLYINIDQL